MKKSRSGLNRPVRRLPGAPVRGGRSERRGSMALAAMISLLVITAGVAVALDRLWLDTAQTEMETAVEAAALRGGQLLASDDLLRKESDIETRLEQAREAVQQIASENLVAGEPVNLDTSPDGDVRFGRLVRRERTGEDVFIETKDNPTSVVVRGLHSRSRKNPVAMFFNSLTGQGGADVAALSEATIDNRIVALQPLNEVPIPALPLAILAKSEDDRRESWSSTIEKREGADRFSYDEQTGSITQGPDGIPEIRLQSAVYRGDPQEANVHLFVVNHHATEEELLSHIRNGWSEEDLPVRLQTLQLDEEPHEFETVNGIDGAASRLLRERIGECRILFLYEQFQPAGRSGAGVIRITRAVAGRILAVEERGNRRSELVVQPGVLTTRTAVLGFGDSVNRQADVRANGLSVAAREEVQQSRNRYIYKLQITN